MQLKLLPCVIISPMSQVEAPERTKDLIIQNAVEAINADLAALPTGIPLVDHFKQCAQIDEEKLKKDPETELFFAGLNLIHAKAHAGACPQLIKVQFGPEVSNYGFIYKSEDTNEISPHKVDLLQEFVSGYKVVSHKMPAVYRLLGQKYMRKWLENEYNLPRHATESQFLDLLEVMHNPMPILIPFDHYDSQRNMVGDLMHFPKELERKPFNYLKANQFPPTIWVSTRDQNDYPRFLVNASRQYFIPVSSMSHNLSCHEAAHLEVGDPIISVIKNGEAHSWITEALAIYLGESYRYHRLILLESVPEIRDAIVRNYDHHFLLFLALAAKLEFELTGSSDISDDFQVGVLEILRRLSQKADDVLLDPSKAVQEPMDLLIVVDPTLDQPEQRLILESIMANLVECGRVLKKQLAAKALD